MAARVHTINDFTSTATRQHASADTGQNLPRQTAFSDHPCLLLNDTTVLQPVRVQPPNGITLFPTAQPSEMRHHPTYSGPSTTTRVLLAGIAGGVHAGTQAYAQAGMMRENWRGMTRAVNSRATSDSVHTTEQQRDTTTGNDLVSGIDELPNPPVVTSSDHSFDNSPGASIDESPGTSITNDQQLLQAADSQTSDPPNTSLETRNTYDPIPPAQSRTTSPRVEGNLEVKFEDQGFEMGSGATEIANPLNGPAYRKDLGVELFNNGRRSNWLGLGSAEDCLGLPKDANDDSMLAQFQHRQFGGSGTTLMHLRNTHTGRTETIDVPMRGRYIMSGRERAPGEMYISTGTHQSISTKMFRENTYGLKDVCERLSQPL
ncbi:hypothetical protein EK21DRAFT_89057 [Setomelanomma holmii]|uniref:Uncharacterized protein n=1 Tax=Setomelanomma holmii TaxID=210430 RepID=A0A9P4H932_9PLEO|nr:hypothetical protein EK21DRAFT_89057 [Setomelanomma holmii]